MADKIFEFLRYGAHPSSIPSISPVSASDFLPSLALLASDSPSLTAPLLTPLASNPHTPQAFAYASLDYSDISQSVLAMEAAAAPALGSGVSKTSDEQHELDSFSMCTDPEESVELDESIIFEMSNEKERVNLVIVSLRKRAAEFSGRVGSGGNPEEVWIQQRKDEGSIWNNDVCMPELLGLLPTTVLRCPTVLGPDHIVWGLLTARWGFVLLFATLINNPLTVRRGLLLLSEFVSTHLETSDMHSSICSDPAAASSSTQSVPHLLPKTHVNQQAEESLLHSQGQPNVVVIHCVEQALLTFIRLSKVSSSMAFMCREALVRNCASAELVLHITLEFLHDELNFLSKMIFSAQKTSEWMLSYLGAAQKDSFCPLPPLIEVADLIDQSSFSNVQIEIQTVSRDDSFNNQQGAAYRVRKALLADAQTIRQRHGWCGRLHGHLRLYCVIIRAADLQPTHEEIDFWLKSLSVEFDGPPSEMLVCSAKVHGFVCERTLQLGMSFFCLVPGLTGSSTRALFHKSLSFLLRSITFGGLKCNPETEFAVWLAVQLLLGRFPDIAMIVREVLGMHVTVPKALMRELHDAAVAAEIISEPSVVVKAVAAVRPKGPISNKNKDGSFTLKCLEQLLSSGHFLRYGVDISEAVMHCISVAGEPIHPLLTQIIQAYAEAPVAVPQGKPGSQPFRMLPLSRSFLEAPFVSIDLFSKLKRSGSRELKKTGVNVDYIARAALTSYYILCRENSLRNTGFEAGYESSESLIFSLEEAEENWWSDLLIRLPFRQFVCYMEENWPAFEHLFPQWLSLASVLFPERLHVPSFLEDFTEAAIYPGVRVHGIPTTDNLEWVGSLVVGDSFRRRNMAATNDSLSQGLGELNFKSVDIPEDTVVLSVDLAKKVIGKSLLEPLPALRIMHLLHCNSGSHDGQGEEQGLEVQMVVVKELSPMLLDPLCSRSLQDSFCLWWSSLQPVNRQNLLPEFLESMLDRSVNSQTTNNATGVVSAQIKDLVSHLEYQNTRKLYNEIVQEPLTLLACKPEVYRTPLLSIFLDLLSEILTVNRRVCLGIASDGGREGLLKREEITVALTAQDSAVCQILLEACVPNTSVGDNINPGPLLEARRVICGFLSHFLQTNYLLKLLHFQGYDPVLVPMMVEGVPVMVQCLDFVQELLQQQDQVKQVFTVILIGNIASAYSELPQSLTAVQQAVAHVSFIQHNVCGSAEFLREVLGAMAQCASAFPKVSAQVVSILQSCVQAAGPLMRSGPPRDPALQSAAISAFKQLICQKVLHGQPPPLPPTFISPMGVT